MTVYDGLTNEEALKVGLHHNEINKWARPMTFLEKVNMIIKLNHDIKAIASVFQKKVGSIYFLFMIILPPFEEEGVYCFANVGRSLCLSVGRPNGFR